MRYISFILIFFCALGCKTYNLTTQDVRDQFSDSLKYARIYCENDNGEKIWLSLNGNSTLLVSNANSSKPYEFYIGSVRYENDSLTGRCTNIRNDIRSILLSDISKIYVKTFLSKKSKYYNLDSCLDLTKQKNDSLNRICLQEKEQIVFLEPIVRDVPIKDSIGLFINACYFIKFKGTPLIKRGIITKITSDSIFITSSFSKQVAKKAKIEYKIFKFRIDDIESIFLYSPGGKLTYKLDRTNYKFISQEINGLDSECQCWFVCDDFTGEIWLYRNELTSEGYYGIREINGAIYW
jgi:hypothetical protein